MDKKEAKNKVEKLKKLLEYHNHLYHVLDKPEISDAAFDSLRNELVSIETEYPNLKTVDSPTNRVGGSPLREFKKVKHEMRMLSFYDAFNEEEMLAWNKKLSNYLHREIDGAYYCELKIDGFAIELIYEDGVLVMGSTRGDGETGEDVTQNLKTIDTIPLNLKKGSWPKRLIVRGEVFLTKREFYRINSKLENAGKAKYANPRNLAAGTIRQLDPTVTRERKLDSFMYDIVNDKGHKFHSDEHSTLKKWGFKTNPNNKRCSNFDEAILFWKHWNSKREALPYEIDGVVVLLDENRLFVDAGVVGKGPRAAIAFKFISKEATTKILNVKVQVGRTGILTPVAILDPTPLGGVTISHASLHNFDEIERLKLKIGDTVIVSRAGDVIPKVVKVITDLRDGSEKKVKTPVECPSDGGRVIKDGVYHRCRNNDCGAVQRRFLEHFVSKNAFDIDGLGGKIIDRLIDEGLISDAADIFALKRGDLEVLERFGKKSAENLIREIEKKSKISLNRFIYSLGVVHVGEETAEFLSAYAYINNIFKKDTVTPKEVYKVYHDVEKSEYIEMHDIGPKVSESIYEWFHNKKNKKLIDDLERNGVTITIPKRRTKRGKLNGLGFVLTGTLSSMSRDMAKDKIRLQGGHVHGSVSRNTNYVVFGKEPGSKFTKASNLGVKIIDEYSFLKMLGE